jgi:quercetin dioxygenase-like cupin family protein
MPRFEALENPATKERYIFLVTEEETDGMLFTLERHQLPGGTVPEHIHPCQEERFEVLSGEMTFRIDGGRPSTYGPGEAVTIPAGVRHALRNDGNELARARIEFRPALNAKGFFEALAGLASEGKTVLNGVPRNPLQAATFAVEFKDEFRIARPPLWVQRLVCPPLASLGRALGYRDRYGRYAATPALAHRPVASDATFAG